ncbi:hypothetical protein B4Q13_22375 [Lacticaseibacillus rhamnosus]
MGPNKNALYPGARSTPTVDGDRVYAMSSDGELACLEKSSGKIVWHKNVRQQFGGKTGWWAYAESPLIDGDVLVFLPGEREFVGAQRLGPAAGPPSGPPVAPGRFSITTLWPRSSE